MPRYIDAEKLTKALGEKCDGCRDKWTDYCTTCCDVAEFAEMINDADDVGIVERKKGKWEEKTVFSVPNIEQWQSAKCSNCGKYLTTPYHYYLYNYNFCPNCGADMREEKTDAEEIH